MNGSLKLVALAAIVLGTLAAPAHADRRMGKIRQLYATGDYEGVRSELLAAYKEKPRPALLFALGQVELNLGNYQAAIDYYQKFIATSPAPDQAALAQQAIGAARMRLTEPDKKPPPIEPPTVPPPVLDQPERPETPPPSKRWTTTRIGFVAFGGAAALLGAGLLVYSHSLGNDHSGTLSDYDRRLEQARTTRWTGLGIAAAGTLIVGVTVAW